MKRRMLQDIPALNRVTQHRRRGSSWRDSHAERLSGALLQLSPEHARASGHAGLLQVTVGGPDDPALAVRAAARVRQRKLATQAHCHCQATKSE